MSLKEISPIDMLWLRPQQIHHKSKQQIHTFINNQKEKERTKIKEKKSVIISVHVILRQYCIYDFLPEKQQLPLALTCKDYLKAWKIAPSLRKERRKINVLLKPYLIWPFLERIEHIQFSLVNKDLWRTSKNTKEWTLCRKSEVQRGLYRSLTNFVFDELFPVMKIDFIIKASPDSNKVKMTKLITSFKRKYKNPIMQREKEILTQQMESCKFYNNIFYEKTPDEYTDYAMFIITYVELGQRWDPDIGSHGSNFETYKSYDLRSRMFIAYCRKQEFNMNYVMKDNKIRLSYGKLEVLRNFIPFKYR